jgi:hypothetical protein
MHISREASLDRNHHQGWYGECFVRALAAAAGLRVAKPEPDVDGIDFHFSWISRGYDDYTIARVQVKSWSTPRESDQGWRFRLSETHFNALAGDTAIPVYLFLVVVPPKAQDYTRADHDWLRLGRAGYWVSLAHRPRIATPRPNQHVPVYVPKQNLLSVESLTALCEGPAGPARLTGTS